jgi:hypothetical protein
MYRIERSFSSRHHSARRFVMQSTPMPARRLEDRIRELCARALYVKGPEWNTVISELQSSIQEHALRVANLNASVTVAGLPELIRERRNA